MPGYRYRFVLIEDSAPLPVLYDRRARPAAARGPLEAREPLELQDPMMSIIEAFRTLSRRGAGDSAWAAPLAQNPLGFLLDSLADAVFVREAGGALLYRNRAAQDIEPVARPPVPAETVRLGPRTYERRCLVVDRPGGRLVIEVMHDTTGAPGR